MDGLTTEEVNERIREGKVNNSNTHVSRTYSDIIRKNVFSPFNMVLFLLGILLLICDEPLSAVSATGIIIVNILISTVQEIRAKRRLDRIALLTRPRVTVLRNGEKVVIDQNSIVLDDIVILNPGDQALIDGDLIECRQLEMDEALLTGESSTVRKNAGDKIYSGSFCVTGEGMFRATNLGEDSYASKMLDSAKKFTSKKTPLEMETGSISKVLMIIAAVLLLISFITEMLIRGNSWGHTLEVFVICIDVVPIALFLLITLTYMIAAIRMADSGVLLQRSNSVESISHVDTVCMDKTGTITTNKLVFESENPYRLDASHLVAIFCGSTGSANRTVETLASKYGKIQLNLVDEIQFSSQRKYSAVRVQENNDEKTLYLGAWTVLSPYCKDRHNADIIISELASKGLRTVALFLGEPGDIHDANGDPIIRPLELVSVIAIRDEVRPDCRETMQVFLDNNMDIKVISGDDPVTVNALFTIANIPGERKIISGPELEKMDKTEFDQTVLNTNIFGRMKPENKEAVVESLKSQGRYVAMIGDGVNDVRSLKSAQVGISLESGAGAARGVSDMVLVKDEFAALPKALIEGRRTVSGMRDILKLYLTRNFALAMMFIIIYIFVGHIPMIPIQNTFYAFVSVSIIAFFMTIFAKPDENKELILPDVLKFCVPSAIMIAAFSIISYLIFSQLYSSGFPIIDVDAMMNAGNYATVDQMWNHLTWSGSSSSEAVARSTLVLVATCIGVLQLLLVAPRYKALSMDGRTNKSIVPIFLVLFLFAILFVMYEYIPSIAVNLVGLVIYTPEAYVIMASIIIIWFITQTMVLKMNVFKKLVDWVEKAYMKKLREEYSKGDVTEE